MGEWMLLPQAELVIAERISRFKVKRAGSPRHTWRTTGLDRISGLVSNVDWYDIANLADVANVPLWECELPDTDDGF